MASCERGTVLADMLSDKAHAEEYRQRFRARADALRKALDELGRLAEGGETSSMVQALNQQASLLLRGHEELTTAMANQQVDAALATFGQKVQPRLEEIGKEATSLVDQENRELAAASSVSAARAARTTAAIVSNVWTTLDALAGLLPSGWHQPMWSPFRPCIFLMKRMHTCWHGMKRLIRTWTALRSVFSAFGNLNRSAHRSLNASRRTAEASTPSAFPFCRRCSNKESGISCRCIALLAQK